MQVSVLRLISENEGFDLIPSHHARRQCPILGDERAPFAFDYFSLILTQFVWFYSTQRLKPGWKIDKMIAPCPQRPKTGSDAMLQWRERAESFRFQRVDERLEVVFNRPHIPSFSPFVPQSINRENLVLRRNLFDSTIA